MPGELNRLGGEERAARRKQVGRVLEYARDILGAGVGGVAKTVVPIAAFNFDWIHAIAAQ